LPWQVFAITVRWFTTLNRKTVTAIWSVIVATTVSIIGILTKLIPIAMALEMHVIRFVAILTPAEA